MIVRHEIVKRCRNRSYGLIDASSCIVLSFCNSCVHRRLRILASLEKTFHLMTLLRERGVSCAPDTTTPTNVYRIARRVGECHSVCILGGYSDVIGTQNRFDHDVSL
jgi:hypothetical protein